MLRRRWEVTKLDEIRNESMRGMPKVREKKGRGGLGMR